MAKYRTAMGKTIDMNELFAKNERTRAVGNMKVNARGDTIDASGKIIESMTSKVNNQYAKTVGNRSAQPTKNLQRSTSTIPRKGNDPMPTKQQVPKEELTEQEKQLEFDMADDADIEDIKSNEINKRK